MLVSTGKQGKSGLGLDAQSEAVRLYLNGGDRQIIDEHTEVESIKRSDRPALDRALASARLQRASLVVSKVDRLTRSVAFIPTTGGGVDVRFADLAHTAASCFSMMVAVAELEAGLISDRTKKALAAAKRRGVKLGGNREVKPTDEMQKASKACPTGTRYAKGGRSRSDHQRLTGGRQNESERHCERNERTGHSHGSRIGAVVRCAVARVLERLD
jgi:DNA invertase Pin-like site-specific DNA recombinase